MGLQSRADGQAGQKLQQDFSTQNGKRGKILYIDKSIGSWVKAFVTTFLYICF